MAKLRKSADGTKKDKLIRARVSEWYYNKIVAFCKLQDLTISQAIESGLDLLMVKSEEDVIADNGYITGDFVETYQGINGIITGIHKDPQGDIVDIATSDLRSYRCSVNDIKPKKEGE